MKKIITTVGTSLFTNFQQDEVRNIYGRDYASISIDVALRNITDKKPRAEEIYADTFKHYIHSIKEKIEDYWFADKYPDNKKASAEIASILKITEEEPEEKFEVHLVATDTLLSVLAAEMISDWFSKHKQLAPNVKEIVFQRTQPNFKLQKESDYVVKDLRVSDQEGYQQGFMNLIALLGRIYKEKQTILNITGGYKAIVPVLTLYGQLREIPLKYLHDGDEEQDTTNELVSIGNLPINFDWSLGELYLDYITKDGLRTISSYPDILDYLRGISLIELDEFKLTPLGQLFRDYIQPIKDKNKGEFGYFIELRLLRHFVENFDLRRIKYGYTYWWNVLNPSQYYTEPQHNKDASKERPIEIDLSLTHDDGSKTWIEVKSWSETGLKKAKKQIVERMKFWQNTSVKPPVNFILLLYKLPNASLDYKADEITEIARLFKDESCSFTVKYFDLPMTNKGLPNIKVLCEKELKLVEYKIPDYHG